MKSEHIHTGIGAIIGLVAAWLTYALSDATTGQGLFLALCGVFIGSLGGWLVDSRST